MRDYTRQVEIGAFRSERGVTQRIRFNVVLEVSHHAAARDDDVDKVISYDTITEAIDHELAAERINLLETLAERVAARCLADRRAVRVFVRIEKLDRIPGALGRRDRPHAPAGSGAAAAPGRSGEAPRPRRGRGWSTSRRSWRSGRRPRPGATRWPIGGSRWSSAWRRAAAGARPRPRRSGGSGFSPIEQAAWAFADGDPRFDVAATRTELDWALKVGRGSRSGRRRTW